MIKSIRYNPYFKTKVPLKVLDKPFPLTRLPLHKFEGVQREIPLFDGLKKVSLKEIAFITKNLETLNLFRGCSNSCSHCSRNAQVSEKGKETILFDDLLEFVYGFQTLSERFGFNVLQGNKYLKIVDDANPSDIPIKGLDGEHNIVEALAIIYKNLEVPTLFETTGWNKGSKYAQKNAEKLVRMIERNPASVEAVNVSINPFSQLMEKSRDALKKGEADAADFYRNAYTSKMANVLATFINLFDIDKSNIIYKHADDLKGNELVNEAATRKLYQEIYEKLRKIVGSKLDLIPQLDPEVLTVFDKSHLIESTGRGRRFFPYSHNMSEQYQLMDESKEWDKLTSAQKEKKLFKLGAKSIDIDGKVYATIPAVNTTCINSPIELTVPTGIELNFMNKESKPIYSEIDLT